MHGKLGDHFVDKVIKSALEGPFLTVYVAFCDAMQLFEHVLKSQSCFSVLRKIHDAEASWETGKNPNLYQ